MEFRMGILFNASRWPQAWRVLDNWLAATTPADAGAAPPRPVQRFEQAGWLGSASRNASPARPLAAPSASPGRACRVRVVRHLEAEPHPRAHGRLVISGRISDVCAELERLAALEQGGLGQA
jgi:hypothetical protein